MATASAKPPTAVAIPKLENGDRLSRDEFERRYAAMPHLKKVELIEGVVYMPSPVSLRGHSAPHADLLCWLGTYRAATPGVLVGDNGTTRLDLDNEPQPDALMMLDPAFGGQARISPDDYVEGAPELVAEIAASSASIDMHIKKNVYRRCGVREYIVWRTLDQAFDWFVSRGGEFQTLAADDDGITRSTVFPGLWLDAAALLRGDLARVSDVTQQGLASPEHGALVQKHRA